MFLVLFNEYCLYKNKISGQKQQKQEKQGQALYKNNIQLISD
jgi:hypothetical protein